MIEDADLLRDYAETKSNEAFSEFVRRRIGLVYTVAFRCTENAELAEEATQAVFVAVSRKAKSLSERPVLIGWLHRSAQFAARDLMRVEHRRMAREQQAYFMSTLENLDSEPAWERLRPVLDDVLSGLNERDRDVVFLRFFEGWTFSQIGKRCSLGENAARMRVERALEKVRMGLGRRGITSTTAVLALALGQNPIMAVSPQLVTSVTLAATSSHAMGVFAGVFQALNTGKLATGISAVSFIAASSLAGNYLVGWRHAERQLATEQKQSGILGFGPNTLQQQAHDASSQLASTRRAATAEINAAIKKTIGKVGTPNGIRSTADMNDAMLKRSRALAMERYGDLLGSLDLKPRQVDRFLNLTNELGTARSSEFFVGFPPTVADVDRQLLELLGAEGFQKFQRYDDELPARLAVRQLAGSTCSTESPLTKDQADALIQSYHEAQAQAANPDQAWETVLTQAKGTLTQSQWDALANILKEAAFAQAVEQAKKRSASR